MQCFLLLITSDWEVLGTRIIYLEGDTKMQEYSAADNLILGMDFHHAS